MINGITIQLCEITEGGVDEFNRPIESEQWIDVADVLVAPASSDEIVNNNELYGRKAVYTLGIPKGDAHNWESTKVRFFGETWLTFGLPTEGIEAMIPLRWNKKVMVCRYE